MINSIEGHQFTSSVGYRPAPGSVREYNRVTKAACSCGAEYEWEGRESQHDQHVLEVVRAGERAKIAAAINEHAIDYYADHCDKCGVAAATYRHAAEIAERTS